MSGDAVVDGRGGDRDVAVSSTGELRRLSELGVLAWADVHAAQQWTHLYGEPDERVRVALALAVRALRQGSIALDLGRVAREGFADEEGTLLLAAAELPELSSWLSSLRVSPCVLDGPGPAPPRPARLVGELLYLERYWHDQSVVAERVAALVRAAGPTGDAVEAALAGPLSDGSASEDQRSALRVCLRSRFAIIAGGPGTGKTHVLGQLVEAVRAVEGNHVLVGVAAPTGKAAARMTESMASSRRGMDAALVASTIHRLLGSRADSRGRFQYGRGNPLPHDLVVVDESSMVSMTLMARLLEALKPSARLVLVGDPDQLSSVEAGSVLGDLTRSPTLKGHVARLSHVFRFRADAGIARLADAVRRGDVGVALAELAEGREATLVAPDAGEEIVRGRLLGPGRDLIRAAQRGDAAAALAALESHRLLCGHRRGPLGVGHWTRLAERWLGQVDGFAPGHEFHVGRPVMVTRNTPDLRLFNGDTGVLVTNPIGNPASPIVAAFPTAPGFRTLPPHLLDGLETVHAMTVHKSQGSQFDTVTVVLPEPGSPLLTRELLYTAVTRARSNVTVVGTPEAISEAVTRPAERTSGLAAQLG